MRDLLPNSVENHNDCGADVNGVNVGMRVRNRIVVSVASVGGISSRQRRHHWRHLQQTLQLQKQQQQ